ncbi:hypothetical protein F4775DRAFT_538677 [Biscogniauxia sp. FL1348]|nr:hypothetical protein F4775DRAFT_538677 [Biscogniauxia sp. FL1348]
MVVGEYLKALFFFVHSASFWDLLLVIGVVSSNRCREGGVVSFAFPLFSFLFFCCNGSRSGRRAYPTRCRSVD